ncbi:MAG: 4-hydroxy-tetrahydrodipicolinate reductase [Lachnospiraceae bacterium]|nr:4-hydroxy-tetrahydrodipicolinate reductase [Lachnospiraceae bacterium]
MIKIIMHGCNGKMGQIIAGLLANDDEATLVAGVDPYDGGNNLFPVFKTLAECQVDADVIIDFSNAGAIDGLLDYCVGRSIPCVLCTTGLTAVLMERLQNVSSQVAILKSANMSLGINLFLKMMKEAAAVLAPAGFDIEIVEKHHNQKVDAPSGTALALGESINAELGQGYSFVYDRSQVREKRGTKEIGFAAVRGGTIVGEHDVIFAGADEVITFSHAAHSKAIFGKGAVQAAKFLAGKPAGLYNMSDVIDAV